MVEDEQTLRNTAMYYAIMQANSREETIDTLERAEAFLEFLKGKE